MIEVMYSDDINKINTPAVQVYLHKRFTEISHTLIPCIEGYFLYIEDFSLLLTSHPLKYLLLPSISEGLFDKVEGIALEGEIVEVSLLFNNEFLMSLVFYGLDQKSLDVITKEKKIEKSS